MSSLLYEIFFSAVKNSLHTLIHMSVGNLQFPIPIRRVRKTLLCCKRFFFPAVGSQLRVSIEVVLSLEVLRGVTSRLSQNEIHHTLVKKELKEVMWYFIAHVWHNSWRTLKSGGCKEE